MRSAGTAASISWREVHARAAALARELPAGRAVLLAHRTGLEFPVAFFACLYAGAIPVAVHPPRRNLSRRTLDLFAAIAEDVRPAAVVGTARTLGQLPPEARALPVLRDASWVAQPEGEDAAAAAARRRPPGFGRALRAGGPRLPAIHVGLHGPTARCHDQPRPADRAARVLPAARRAELAAGRPRRVAAPPARLRPRRVRPQRAVHGHPVHLLLPVGLLARPRARWLATISSEGGTYSGAPAFAYDLCARVVDPAAIPGLDLSAWTIASSGGEPIPPSTLERFAARFAPYRFDPAAFLPSYGLAEAVLCVSARRGVKTCRGRVSVGSPLPGQRAIVVDPGTRSKRAPTAARGLGRRARSLAAGYWRRPAETAEVEQGACPRSAGGARICAPGTSVSSATASSISPTGSRTRSWCAASTITPPTSSAPCRRSMRP